MVAYRISCAAQIYKLLKHKNAMKHFLSSLVNAGVVTICTSGAMTILNADHFAFTTWLRNWCISWSIVFVYVFLFAGRISKKIHGL